MPGNPRNGRPYRRLTIQQGRPLYALPDLARAEKKTRGRALRLVGIGAH